MLLSILYIVGITAEGMTGGLSAAREKMDLFGVMMIATVTAIGGGSIRDMLLGHYPLVWVKQPLYILIVVGAAVLSVHIPSFMHYFKNVFLGLDAIGLVVFAILGTRVGVEVAGGFIIPVVASIITGVMGGVLRDLLCNRIPLVFQKELYASIAFLATCLYLGLIHIGVLEEIAVISTLIAGVALRILAIYFKWGLPTFEYLDYEYDRKQSVSPRLIRSLSLRPSKWKFFNRKTIKKDSSD